MIKEGWNIIKNATQAYFSNGYFWILVLCAIICMLLNYKKKNTYFVVWYMVICAVMIFNPLVALILSKLGMDGVYWRSFWLFPIGCVIAYMFTNVISSINKKIVRLVLVCLSAFTIMKCGSMIYNSSNFSVANNAYKIPDDVIEVSDYIENGNTVLAPLDLLCWLRTYNADIYLPIGRQEIYFSEYSERHQVVDILANSEILDVEYVAEFAISIGCKYVVFKKEKQIEGSWEDFGYYLVGETTSYFIYQR